MKNFEEQLLIWKSEIRLGNYSRVSVEFKKYILENRWSLTEEVKAGSFCVIALNAATYKVYKSNESISESPLVIFDLTKLFCESAAKSWDLVDVDFPAGVFYIFKYLLDQNFIAESLFVADQACEYQKKCAPNVASKNQPNVQYSMLACLCSATINLRLNDQNFKQFYDLLAFLSANSGYAVKRSKHVALLKPFSSFLLKCAHSPNSDYVDDCSTLLRNLARSACESDENAESTFMDMIRVLVYEICELSSSKNRKKLLLDCVDAFEQRCNTSPTCVSFCRNVYRIAVCLPEDKCLDDVVARANYELRTLIASGSTMLKSAVYFSTVVIIKMRDWTSAECPFRKSCAIQLFELLYTLAEQTYRTDLNEFGHAEPDHPRHDICASAYLCSFLLQFADSIADLNPTAPDVYAYVLKSVELCRQCVERGRHCDPRKRQQMYYSVAASCVNLYRKFVEYESQTLYNELCSIVCPAFATLDAEDTTAENLQISLKKLIVNMCSSYRFSGRFVDVLIASLVWSLILPKYASAFMNLYGAMKQKLFGFDGEQRDHSLHKLTCLDLLEHRDNTWPLENLNEIDSLKLLRAELDQCKIHNVCSVSLMKNIINAIRNSRVLKPAIPPAQQIPLYTTIGEILTNTDSSESLKFLKKFDKDINVLINALNKDADSPPENECATIYKLLGDLFYVKFRIDLLIHRSENESEMKSLSAFKKPAQTEPGMEPSLGEDGNITLTNYVCLSAQQKLTKLLNAAVSNWGKGFRRKSELNLSYVKDAALVYRLYCDATKEVDAWKLLHSAAAMANDADLAVYAYSYLLMSPWDEDLILKRHVEDRLLPQVAENVRLFYRLSYLNRRFVDGFNEEDEKTLSSTSEDDVKKHNLWPNYCFLVSRCTKYNLISYPKSPLLMNFLAYSLLMCRLKNKKWSSLGECSELQCLLFDVVLFSTTLYVQQYRVAEAKAHLKDPINLLQKLSLPLRTCQYLNATVRIDTLTCALDECYLKLQDACDILEVKRDSQAILRKASKQQAPVLSPEAPQRPDWRADGSGRRLEPPSMWAIAPLWKFQMPDFVAHDDECVCSSCSSFEYCRLLCEMIALFGAYYRLAERRDEAVDFFEGFIRMYDVVLRRFSHLRPPLRNQFTQVKAFAMYEYANHWAMTDDFEKAATFNAIATNCSKDSGSDLRHDCLEQLWAISDGRASKAEKDEAAARSRSTVTKKRIRVPSSRLPAPPSTSKSTTTTSLKTPAAARKAAVSRTPRLFIDVDDDDLVGLHNRQKVPAEVTPYPRHSRRALFDQFASPPPPPPEASQPPGGRTRRPRNATPQTGTPPDIVMQPPSVIARRANLLSAREKALTTTTTSSLADGAAKLRQLQRRLKREAVGADDAVTTTTAPATKAEPRERRRATTAARRDKENVAGNERIDES